MGVTFETDATEVLALKLRQFYGELRTSDGKKYCKSSFTNIRSGLNRHLTSPPHNRQINLMHDRAFQGANQVFYGCMRALRQEGLDKAKHKDSISTTDMAKLYSSGVLSDSDPESLQYKVYVEVALHFCRRGREGLRELSKSSFCEKTDRNGKSYVTLTYNELEKNHQGLSNKDESEEPRMYEQGGPNCPLASFRLYMSKLNEKCDAFFQRPNNNFAKNGMWYANAPVGKNTLATFMKSISKKAGLDKVYTNHCLRVTAVSVLHNKGVQALDICSVSRHKHTDSIRSYSKGPSDEKRYAMSSLLHCHGKSESVVAPLSPRPSTSGWRQVTTVPSSPQAAAVALRSPHAVNSSRQLVLRSPTEGSSSVAEAASNTVIMSNQQAENRLFKSMFSGAAFQSNSNPVFNFNGNFNLY